MKITDTFAVSMIEASHVRLVLRRARGVFALLLLSTLVGCASTVTQIETWNGSPPTAANAATLEAPGSIHVAQVNGQSVTNYMMDDLALDYALLPGDSEVVFTYKTIWAKSGVVRNGESKVHVIESEPQVVRFDAEADEVYQFELDKPGSRREAEAMMADFSTAIVTNSGKTVASSAAWSPEDATDIARTPVSGDRSVADADQPDTDDSALRRLKDVWETASDAEKKAFLRWAFE